MEKGIKDFIRQFGKEKDFIFREASLRLASALVTRTPVDEGETVADWDVSVNQTPQDTKPPGDPKRTITKRRLREMLSKLKYGDWAMFENTNEAAIFLEFGSSKQAPTGIVRTVAKRWPAFVKGAARATLNKVKKRLESVE